MQAVNKVWRLFGPLPLVLALVAATAVPAGAALALRATLTRVAGEDPSIPGTADVAFQASGAARWDGTSGLREGMLYLDAARFPAGCPAQVTVGTASATVPLALLVPSPEHPANPLGPTTTFDFRANGTATAGQTASVRIRCESVVNGVRVRHETAWQGALQ
jgi:hypothetical protein